MHGLMRRGESCGGSITSRVQGPTRRGESQLRRLWEVKGARFDEDRLQLIHGRCNTKTKDEEKTARKNHTVHGPE